MNDQPAPLRIANCSGFFGDRIAAAKEMVEGGPIDVLMGDWLAELTMYILHKTRQRSGGYARTFLRQLEDVLPDLRRARHHRGLQRRRAASRGAGRRRARAGQAPGRRGGGGLGLGRRHHGTSGRAAAGRGALRQPRHRRGAARRRAGRHGQRLPAGPAHRRRAGGRRPGGGHGSGHRRRTGGRSGAARVRLAGRRPRRHRRCRRRRPRHRVRRPVLRRQLRLLRGDPAPRTHRLPHRRDAGRRLLGDHQAPRLRGRRHRRARSPPSCSTRSADPATSAPMPWPASTPLR